jgi:ribose 5-phosphate isomerase A
LLADYFGPVNEPSELATRLSQTPGIVEHGLFPPHLTSEVLVATGASIRTLRFG